MRNSLCIFLLASVFVLKTGGETFATDPTSPAVSPELLEAKSAEIKEHPGLEEETRSLLSSLYLQALDDLKKAAHDAERTAALLETARTAPEQIRLFRDREKPPEPAMSPDSSGSIEDRLTQEAAATARHYVIQKELAEAESRPPLIRERLDALKQEQVEVAAALSTVSASDEDAETSQARRWSREARSAALEAEMQSQVRDLGRKGKLVLRLVLLGASLQACRRLTCSSSQGKWPHQPRMCGSESEKEKHNHEGREDLQKPRSEQTEPKPRRTEDHESYDTENALAAFVECSSPGTFTGTGWSRECAAYG